MGIFESSKYLVKWSKSLGEWGHKEIPEIFDEEEHLVGKLDLTGKFSTKLLMTDTNDSTILSASKKRWSMTNTYEIKNEQNNLVGMVKLSSPWKHENLSFYDPNKKELLKISFIGEKKGNYFSGLEVKDFEINQLDGKKIAKVFVTMDQECSWSIDILDSSYDRKIILGLIMGLFSSGHDSRITGN